MHVATVTKPYAVYCTLFC